MRSVKNINELTPVDCIPNICGLNEMYFKRDDLYLPFDDMPWLGGGKVRQTISLFEKVKDEISLKDGIITYVSINSPQSVIVAKVANMMGIKCNIVIGVNDNLDNIISKHKTMFESNKLGANILNVVKVGYNNVLLSHTKRIANENNYYIIYFGINIEEYTKELTECISNQVKNIPDELDYLIIPVGSGIQMGGILNGIKKYNKKVKRIIGIQISNIDQSNTINKILKDLETDIVYEQIVDNTYKYAKHLDVNIYNSNNRNESFKLNVVYEAKSFDYFKKHKNEFGVKKNDKVLFWVIGDNNFLYN